jgi:hypothetical protein
MFTFIDCHLFTLEGFGRVDNRYDALYLLIITEGLKLTTHYHS